MIDAKSSPTATFLTLTAALQSRAGGLPYCDLFSHNHAGCVISVESITAVHLPGITGEMAQEQKPDSLEERLLSHARAFDGLLDLMPAKIYYGEDTSDQWQRKKQTKEEKNSAKRAKLDPDNVKSAKDVLDEQAANAKKRKREEDGEEDISEIADIATEQPISKAAKKGKLTKKQKREEKGDVSEFRRTAGDSQPKRSGESTEQIEESRRVAKAAKQKEKKEQKRAKAEKKATKAEAKKARKQQEAALEEDSKAATEEQGPEAPTQSNEDVEEDSEANEREGGDIEPLEMDNGFAEEDLAGPPSTTSPSPTDKSSTFDNSNLHSGSSSISSIVPPPITESNLPRIDTQTSLTTPTAPSDPKPSAEELKARLQARIDALRTARKADAPSAPANRQELMESRRRKEEERKAHKKELRRKAKEEEQRLRTETLTRGSPLLSNTNSPLLSPGSPAASSEHNNFSFGRIAFANGQRASASLDAVLTPSSKLKGPSDPRTALQAAEKRQSRLSALDPEKQADIAEKDVWLNARKRAHGERIRDDTSLLKKTLKRKEKQKKKSEKEWKERIDGVKTSQVLKQRKREANLQKRKDEKGSKKSGGGSKAKSKAAKKQKARPGFEGSFRAKAPGAGGEKQRRR